MQVSVIANRFFKEIIMSLPGIDPRVAQAGETNRLVRESDNIGFSIEEAQQFASQNLAPQAIAHGDLPNAAFGAFADIGNLGPLDAEGLNTAWNLLTGKPVDLSAIPRLVDGSGLLGDLSAQDLHSGVSSLIDGDIGSGIERTLNAFGVDPSINGLNPFDLIG